MKAFAIDAYKGPLTLHDVPEPVAGPGQVVIAIHASSVNPVDLKVMEGMFKLIQPYHMPLVMGHDCAGVVERVGAGVTGWAVGDEIFVRPDEYHIGCFAERLAVPADQLAPKPRNLSMEEAASIPLVAQTAWQVMVDRAQMTPGQKILIHAGSGGVGTAAIQLAKYLGLYVATTCGTRNVDLVRSLGADEVIDYTKQDFAEVLTGFDVVFDTLGGEIQEKSLRVLKPGGKIISIYGPPDAAFAREVGANWLVTQIMKLMSFKIRRKARAVGVEYSFLRLRTNGAQLAEIGKIVEEGRLKPVIDSVHGFDATPDAVARVASGRATGKVVIRGAG